MDALDPIYPFRWNLTSRSQLGELVGTPGADRDTWLNWEELTARSYRWRGRYSYAWFLNELTLCATKVLALSENSDLCFVGRSPESLFDYLSGLLFDTSWAERLTLLHFSMGWISLEKIREEYPGALDRMRKYLTLLKLDPEALAQRDRPVAFVDIVASGNTFGSLVEIIHDWCKQKNFDWGAVQRKIRIVGLIERAKTSPKTWRWQQHAEWLDMLPSGRIKNVSIPMQLFHFLGAGQPKTTLSYSPRLWGDPHAAQPLHDEVRLRALRVAVALLDDGRDKAQRQKFAAELSKQLAMQHAWFRSLISELKG